MSSSQPSSSEQKFNYPYSPTNAQYQLTNVHFPSSIGHNFQLNTNSFNQHILSQSLPNYSLTQMHQHHHFMNNFKNQYYSKQNLDFETSCEDFDDEQNQQPDEAENKNDDNGFQTKLNSQLILSSSQEQKTPSKIRKRSANQAYEYLTSLADSKTFQTWLSNNETDFTWVHKRNSMTNAGKKYYYICNYRIKKGYHRCPAVIYALFPNNNDSTVMVYSCGEHEHKRILFNDCPKQIEANSIKKNSGNKSKTASHYQPSNRSCSSSSSSTPPTAINADSSGGSQILTENYAIKSEHDEENENTCLNDIECDEQNNSNRMKSSNDNENIDDMEDIIDDDENLNQDINNNEPFINHNTNRDDTNYEKSDDFNYLNCKSLPSGQHHKQSNNVSSYLNPLRQLNINKQFQEFSLISNSNKSLMNSNYLLARALSAQQHNQNLGNTISQISSKQTNHRKRALSSLNERFECDEDLFNSSVQSIQNHFNSNYHQINHHLQHHHHRNSQHTNLASNIVAQQQALVNHLTSNRLGLNNSYIQGNKSFLSNQISSILPSQVNTSNNNQNQSSNINVKNSSIKINHHQNVNSNRDSPICTINLSNSYIP